MPLMHLGQVASASRHPGQCELTMAEYTPIEAAPMPPTVITALAMCADHTFNTRCS